MRQHGLCHVDASGTGFVDENVYQQMNEHLRATDNPGATLAGGSKTVAWADQGSLKDSLGPRQSGGVSAPALVVVMAIPCLALMGSRSRRRTAWVMRWDWVGEHAAVEQRVAAVLPPQWGHETVKRVVEVVYAASAYVPAEMPEAARRGGHNPYPAKYGRIPGIREDGVRESVEYQGEVTCGHNPFLIARKAKVRLDPKDPGEIVYEDLPRPRPFDLRSRPAGWPPAAPLEPPT